MKTDVPAGRGTQGDNAWYSRSPASVAETLDVDPAHGLTAAAAADRLRANGPNALLEEKPKPGWLRFLDEYRSYMQIILLAAALVPLFVQEWGTAVLLLLLTVLNAAPPPPPPPPAVASPPRRPPRRSRRHCARRRPSISRRPTPS